MRVSIAGLTLFPLVKATAFGATFGTTFDATDDTASARFSDFDWDAVEPKAELEYHDCYNEYKCARLEVPLDWKNESDTRRATIAIMKLPAVVGDDDPAFSGSVFTNPGGPGGSGVEFIPRIAHHLQKVMDKPGKKHYEIISFDPRGVGQSTPAADCYSGNILARQGTSLETRGTLGLGSSPESLAYNYALTKATNMRCSRADELVEESIFKYIGTPNVVRDMVEMVDQIDALRSKEAAARGQSWLELKKRNGDGDETPRLQYIGFSYGTVLGNYFASMYPGRVHRVVLDSVCDIEDYAHGPGWLTSLRYMDPLFDEFFKGCYEAGPEYCELVREDDASWTDISRRVWDYLVSLDESPLGLIGPNDVNAIVTGSDVRGLIGGMMYKPIKTFKLLAHVLDRSIDGEYEELVDMLAGSAIPNLETGCSAVDAPANKTTDLLNTRDVLYSVICQDGEDVTDKDLAYWHKYVKEMQGTSRLWGDVWATLRFACSTWPFEPNWKFNGPFTTPKADPALSEGKPSAPLLFLANRFDPVTPVTSARAMAHAHNGAQLIVFESMGHGVAGSAPSECLAKHLAEYMDTGKVPDEETTCEPECGPWSDVCETYRATSQTFSMDYLLSSASGRFPLMV
ncbi:TAP-like protein-domain-containing protein [Emericellopsis atlantica]|uniref:TAP-like protein-domain-containing protein n=1 Tax=Emericellopsis atlantica TaxID=2614577 RepID=A0A9P7ZH77_9HYPO|nr:TAP-like protein-domain-containing protein [Emericellopsis atlantica]KAG9251627.1 TAP-like protein-domain-containing protein [Emericellopsis atlantica]